MIDVKYFGLNYMLIESRSEAEKTLELAKEASEKITNLFNKFCTSDDVGITIIPYINEAGTFYKISASVYRKDELKMKYDLFEELLLDFNNVIASRVAFETYKGGALHEQHDALSDTDD